MFRLFKYTLSVTGYHRIIIYLQNQDLVVLIQQAFTKTSAKIPRNFYENK